MKRTLTVLVVLVAAAAAAAAQSGEVRTLTQARLIDAGAARGDELVVLDLGTGPVAAVFVAKREILVPAFAETIAPIAERFRVIAFVVEGHDLAGSGGADAIAAAAARAIDLAGIERACVVSCGDCLPAAVALAEDRPSVGSLVLMGTTPTADIPFAKPVFLASGAASLEGVIERALIRDPGRGRSAQYRKMMEQ